MAQDEHLSEQRQAAPKQAGVYFFKDLSGEVLYIGKAKNLQRRINSHFQRPAGERGQQMVRRTEQIEWIVLGSEHEALIAEQNFIRRYQPRYNIRLKDDRTYPWIAVSLDEEYPRIFITRERHRPGRKYFGPYSDARAARRACDLVGRVFQLRSCTGRQPGRATGSPCLDYHIGRCSAPCTDLISKAAYRAQAEQATACLADGYRELKKDLQQSMQQASEAQNYEAAGRYRDLIQDLEKLDQRQQVAGIKRENFDLAALHLEDEDGNLQIWRVRNGLLEGQVGFYLRSSGQTREEIFLAALLEYYENQEVVPPRILTDSAFAQSQEGRGLGQLLELDRGTGIQVSHTHRGGKHQLWQSLNRTTRMSLGREQLKAQEAARRTQQGLQGLAEILGNADLPQRIECYDVSHLAGQNTYVSMVVFEAGVPRPEHYRIFKVPDQPGAPDDYLSLAQALERRCASWQNYEQMSPYDPSRDDSFAKRPDLILIDGGMGQLQAARKAACHLIETGSQILSLAKEREEIFAPKRKRPIILPDHDPTKLLLQHARDEAHRFALRHHRKARGEIALGSGLDGISGVGPARRGKLLRSFGSLEYIRQASLDELEKVVPRQTALSVYDHFHPHASQQAKVKEQQTAP